LVKPPLSLGILGLRLPGKLHKKKNLVKYSFFLTLAVCATQSLIRAVGNRDWKIIKGKRTKRFPVLFTIIDVDPF